VVGNIKFLEQAGRDRAATRLDTEAALKEQDVMPLYGKVVGCGGAGGAAPDDNGVVVSSW
jgi:hypothetical protein